MTRTGKGTVATLWVGGPLTAYENLCLRSFAAAGYHVEVFAYDGALTVPNGVALVDARQIIPEPQLVENSREPGRFAVFADIFRYRLLQECDVTWIDADVFLLGSALPADEYLFGFEDPESAYVANGILRAPCASRLLQRLVERTANVVAPATRWGETGPLLLTAVLGELGMMDVAQPWHVLYPVRASEVSRLFDPAATEAVRSQMRGAATVHLWNEVLRRGGAPVKRLAPPVGSWLADAFRQCGVESPSGGEHDVDWIIEAVTPATQRGELEAALAYYRRECAEMERTLAAKHKAHALLAIQCANSETALANAERKLREAEDELGATHQRLQSALADLAEISTSLSWHLTKPLRWRRTARRP